MKIIAIITGKGFTKDMYERLRQEVKWETEQVDGWIMHAVRFDESGDIHMINIWESIEKMNEAFVSRLMPVMKKIGIPEPRGEVYPAYNIKQGTKIKCSSLYSRCTCFTLRQPFGTLRSGSAIGDPTRHLTASPALLY